MKTAHNTSTYFRCLGNARLRRILSRIALIAALQCLWPAFTHAQAPPSGGQAIILQGGIKVSAGEIGSLLSSCADCDHSPPPGKHPVTAERRSWQARSNLKGTPADAQIAASSTHVIVTFMNALAWYGKGGVKQGELSAAALFREILPTLPGSGGRECGSYGPTGNSPCAQTQSDMRVIFDGYRKRFWILHGAGVYPDNTSENRRGIFLLAVSLSEDPADGFYLYWFDAVTNWGKPNDAIYSPGDVADYPSIGIDPFGFHVTNMVLGMNGQYKYWRVAFFRGDEAISGIPAPGWEIPNLKDPDGSAASLIQPAVHHGWTGRAYYSAVARDKESVLIWALTDALQPTQEFARFRIPLTSRVSPPVDAPQKSSCSKIMMSNIGSDVLKSVYRAGLLHLVMHDSRDWFGDGTPLSSIRLVRVFVLGNNLLGPGEPTFIDRTFGKNGPGDNPNDRVHYGWPAIEVNKDGTMVIAYARSGGTLYPEARYTIRSEDTAADVQPSKVLKEGEGPYGTSSSQCPSLRWGDTGGTGLDPFDEQAIWIAHQYANATRGYDIWVRKVGGKTLPDWYFPRRYRHIASGVKGPAFSVTEPSLALARKSATDIEITGRIGNQGDGPAPATKIAVYLRDGINRRLLTEMAQPRLGPGGVRSLTINAKLPRLRAGVSYTVEVLVDPQSQHQEYNEENNRVSLSL